MFLTQHICFTSSNQYFLIKNIFSLRKTNVSESTVGVSGSSLPRPRKRSLAFPRPEIVFGATFYKGFYKAFDIRPFSRILASPGQVSPDVSRLIIFLRNTASALNEAYLKRVVKQNASNQIQPQMKTFSKDL